MRFCEIIGQDEIKKLLRQAVRDGRIAHAQLFTGISGVGKLGLALAYAQYIACPNKTNEDSCGVCPSCLQYQKLQHPDLHFAFPIVKDSQGDVCDTYVEKFRNVVLENTQDYDVKISDIKLSTPTEEFLQYTVEDLQKDDVLKANSTKELTISLKALHTTTPTARSTTFPLEINSLNSFGSLTLTSTYGVD